MDENTNDGIVAVAYGREIGGLTMRDIIFKAKRKDNGEWVYGSLLMQGNIAYIAVNVRYNEDFECGKSKTPKFLDVIEVDPDTVCEYTGVPDSTKWDQLTEAEKDQWLKTHTADEWRGKMIYEGDILRVYNPRLRRGGTVAVEWRGSSFALPGVVTDLAWARTSVRAEIIGNRFDNPELLNP